MLLYLRTSTDQKMKRISTSYFLIFIVALTNFINYNSARYFEKEFLVTIEEIRDEGGARLKLHPLTAMSEAERKDLCAAAKENALLSDDPSKSKLYTQLFKMKVDSGKEGTIEDGLTSSAVDESASLSENYINRMHKYTQLSKNRSQNDEEGEVAMPYSSRSMEERATLLQNDYTSEAYLRDHLNSMQLNTANEPDLFDVNHEISTNRLNPNVMTTRGDEKDVAIDHPLSTTSEEQSTNTSLPNDYTRTEMNTDLLDQNTIPDSEIEDFLEDYEEEVALVCPTTPVVRLGLGESTDEIKIMFAYVFSVEAIHSVTLIPDEQVDDNMRKNHLLAFENEQLHALCNTTRKCVPIEDVVFKREKISKPQFLEIAYLPHFEKPNIRDVVITCPLNPYIAYLRFQPPNEMRIMITDTALFELLKKYGLNAEDLIRSMKMPFIDESASDLSTKLPIDEKTIDISAK